ncbi:MAG: hypothetical protein IJF02_07410 [Oscillospiraceae bacterium]|nr:hypothetical protein [Oscillospiraceae bacterium]
MNYIHDLMTTTKKLVDMINCSNIGINMVCGNMRHFPQLLPLEDAMDLCGDKLFYTHLKNSMPIASGDRVRFAQKYLECYKAVAASI